MAPILVVAGFQLGCLILLEATLSFLYMQRMTLHLF
jgi:ABC-type dipeptide/oligopeptide/nickel transport system permease subunit